MDNEQRPANLFSCRFECSHDYTAFVVLASQREMTIETRSFQHMHIGKEVDVVPDVMVEFYAPADLDTVRDIMDKGVDLHVGLQTLRQASLKDNSLERDYSL